MRLLFRRLSSQEPRPPIKRKNPLVLVGAPLVIFIVAGTYVLSTFMQTHMEVKDRNNKGTSERTFNLEEEHRKLMQKLDLENFSLSRIPRPEELAAKDKEKEKEKKSNSQSPKGPDPSELP